MQKKHQKIENGNYLLTLSREINNCNHKTNNIDIPNIDMNQSTTEEIKKKSKREIYGKGYEAKTIKNEIGDFNYLESDAYKRIINQFGRSIRINELLGILNSINIYLKIKKNVVLPKIRRNEKRSFQLLIKYIEANKELIYPYLQYITLCNSSFQKISLDIQ